MNLKEGITVLSLFDGMSCGMIALDRISIKVKAYYASEIDKPDIKVSKHNWPNIIHIGDVTKVRYAAGWLYTENGNLFVGKIDLLIGGSPCQGFSFAGKQLNFEDARSKLFFEYVRLKEETQCEYFLLENVVMKYQFQDVITQALGVGPIFINSALVSAQIRKRLYWTNIENITQPADRGIYLKDVIQDNRYGAGRIVGRKINPDTNKRDDSNPDLKAVQRFEYNSDPGKTNCLTTVEKDNILKKTDGCIQLGSIESKFESRGRVYSENRKSSTLTAVCCGHQEVKLALSDAEYRKLTPIEYERLQCVPDNYTSCVAKTHRYHMLGNGWTVDVICHLFEPLLHVI